MTETVIGAMIGTIIKKNRLDQNMSQESLCKGICTVSYLSKIENGQAKSSHEILALLFNRLKLPFPETIDAIEGYQTQIYDAINTLILGDNVEAVKKYQGLAADRALFLASPLVIDWLILDVYFAIEGWRWDDVSANIEALEAYSKYYSTNQRYHVYTLKGQRAVHEVVYDAALEAFMQAQHSKRDGMIIGQLGMTYFFKGDYVSAITYGNEAYIELMDAGNIYVAIEISGFIAAAYSNLNQIDKALHIYKRQLNLTLHAAQNHVRYSVFYNIGATYLMLGDFEKTFLNLNLALECLNAEEVGRAYYLYQKLILCHIGLGQLPEARAWLEKLESNMAASNGAADASMIQSIKWLAHFKHHDDPKQEPGYLDDLKATFDLSRRDSHFGFHLFYGQYLIEAYKANRRYKEAMTLMESLKLS